ncbi:hypothetical protein NV230_00950 [Mesomycoplasma hyorhinis]|uniref:hypothetical protein n=1 Tax=Mesomycoplasma hyorhinis TaxID=2100 RepID=UPI00220080EF|nr:hypothetical protein NV230_00950 [Mesomycoplasma hyorhinis]
MNTKLSEELIYNNFLVKIYRKTTVFSSFFFIIVFLLSIFASLNVIALKYRLIQIKSAKVSDFFNNINNSIYWLIFWIFIILTIIFFFYIFMQVKKRKKIISILPQAIYLQIHNFDSKDIFLKEVNLWDQYEKFKNQKINEYKINYGVGILSSWFTTICVWILIWKIFAFGRRIRGAYYNYHYIPHYFPLRKNKIKHYLIKFNFTDFPELERQKEFFPETFEKYKQEFMEKLEKYSNFEEYFLENTAKFFKSKPWSKIIVTFCLFISTFSLIQFAITMFIDLYINVGMVIQSELAYVISFFVILTIFSGLWVLSDQIVFEYHLKEFIIFNFQVKERYNPYLKQEYKN